VAVAAAIALSVVGGGGGVGSLGDVLHGPAVPRAEAATNAAQPRRDEQQRVNRAGPAATGPVPRRPAARRPVARRTPTTLPFAPRRPSRPPSAKAPPATGSPPPVEPSQPPQEPPSHPIHDTGSQVAETVRPLPVAGPVAADAVQAVVDLVDPPA